MVSIAISPLLADAVLSAVDDDCLAGDECRVVARQEQDGAGDVRGLTEPLDRLVSQVARFCASDCAAVAAVSVKPGNTAFAVMPSPATSFASPRMNPIIPIFDAM